MKNGPPSILSSFKYEVYQFKSFDGYNCYDDGIDRGEASTPSFKSVREKAKAVVELLTNEEFLEEERVKAKTIRERLAGSSSDAMYAGYGSSSTGAKYGGTNYKNEGTGGGGSKYAGQGSGTKNASFTGYSTGSYDEGKSTLDKYKNISGGNVYAKENLAKEKEKEKEKK